MKLIHALALALGFTAVAKAAPQPNIVFFFADDQTSSSLGCWASTGADPHLDRLAKQGTRFSNAHVSQAICWVSRDDSQWVGWTILGTAAEPDRATPESVRELYSDLLRANGYRTGFFGKWHARCLADFSRPIILMCINQGPQSVLQTQPDGSLRHETEVIVDHGIEFIKNQPKESRLP